MELSTKYPLYKGCTPPEFSNPEICGSYSVNRDDNERYYSPGNSNLRFLRGNIPKSGVRYDLNYKADSTISRIEPEKNMEFFCRYLKDNKSPIDVFDTAKISLENAPFVIYGDCLREISQMPYKSCDTLCPSASLFKGVIYIHFVNPNDRGLHSGMSAQERKCFGWGFKFQQHLLSDESYTKPDIELPLNESKEFFYVYKTKLDKHHLIYASTVDAVACEESDVINKSELKPENLQNFKLLEMKICKHLYKPMDQEYFRKNKAREWWLKSRFSGIDTILCGHRDGAGNVTELKFYKTSDLPRDCKKYWDTDICLKFLNDFLTYVKKCLSHELKSHRNSLDDIRNLPKVYNVFFEREPRSNVKQSESNEDISILPEWYFDLLSKV